MIEPAQGGTGGRKLFESLVERRSSRHERTLRDHPRPSSPSTG